MDFDQFVRDNTPEKSDKQFSLVNSKMLDVKVDGTVMAKAGSMVAYDGDMTFTGKASAEGGVTGFLKEAVTNEGTPVMEVEGEGHLYLADQEKKVQIIQLDAGEELSVNGNDILAFDSQVDYEIGTIGSLAGASSGGLTNVFLKGPGHIAITTHGDPVVVTPPVKTDPNATVAWSGSLTPEGNVDTSLSDVVGQSSGETYQLEFSDGDGVVVVQPFEERQPGNQQQ